MSEYHYNDTDSSVIVSDLQNEIKALNHKIALLDGMLVAVKNDDQWSRARVNELEAKLKEAVDLLKAGKKEFAPHTTNSHVDVFISRYEQAQQGGE